MTSTNQHSFQHSNHPLSCYQQLHHDAAHAPELFWQQQAARLDWFETPTQILTQLDGDHYQWFADGVLNTCYLALDSQVNQGRGAQTALIYDSPVTGIKRSYSYLQLLDEVALFAGVLQQQGVGKGDRVVIYLPMIPQALIAMLAVARLGAVHSVVFGGFSAHELALRIDDATPKVIVSASCGIEINRLIAYKPLLDEALELAQHQVTSCVIFQREQLLAEMQPGRDLDWVLELTKAHPVACVPVQSTDPLYILYTSGTTGKPKGVVHVAGAAVINGAHTVTKRDRMAAVIAYYAFGFAGGT